jgi:transposase
MFRIPRQSYTEEFKREAVKLVEGGMKPAEVARHLGITEQTLGNWRKAKAAGKLTGNSKVVTPAQMELSRLRAEVIRLKAENEILKKAAAYFAKESL